MIFNWSIDKNHDISPDERDYQLNLSQPDWYKNLNRKRGWVKNDKLKCPQRIIAKKARDKKLKEIIVRFPSAPIYGIHREFDYQFRINRINYHTFRIIQDDQEPETPIKHVYIIHNGLNEIDGMNFFYDVALEIINNNKNSACIIRPFPGHLTRFPLPGRYSEQPLDRYLRDSGDLFRQYLRFMIETRWLISTIVPIRNYQAIVGYDLNEVGKLKEAGTGRSNANTLAAGIYKEWQDIYEAESTKPSDDDKKNNKRDLGEPVTEKDILESIESIRKIIEWEETPGNLTKGPKKHVPHIHVLGYSLGGFLAQCIYFSWPFAISTCTTICSGGWLRDLAPTKFSHPEEWQQVLYGLRFEIEDSMLNNRIYRNKPEKLVSGINQDAFSFYTKIFYEVFIQVTPEKYQSRVSELGHRILFIVGGDDSIVKTKSLLDASPQGGINMVEIANLGHFLSYEGSKEESEWNIFWFPYVMELISKFSERGGEILLESLKKYWCPPGIGTLRYGSNSKGFDGKLKENEVLKSEGFREALTKVVVDLEKESGSWLFIARNKPPTILFGKDAIHVGIPTLHYEESKWVRYLDYVNFRSKILMKLQDRLTIIMPYKVEDYFTEARALLPPKHNMYPSKSYKKIWNGYKNKWRKKRDELKSTNGCPFLLFDLNNDSKKVSEDTELTSLVKKELKTNRNEIVNVLPDIWLFLGEKAIKEIFKMKLSEDIDNIERESAQNAFVRFAKELVSARDSRAENKLKGWIENDYIQIVKVSGAEFNPQYRGQIIHDFSTSKKLIIHCALALSYSTPCQEC